MGVFIPNGFGTATIRMQLPGESGPGFNVLGLEREGTLTALQTAQQWGDAINNAGSPWTLLSNQVDTDQVEVRLNIGGELHIAAVALSITGGGADPMAPPQVSYLLKKGSGFAGRANRGRIFLPGVEETAVDPGGALTSGAISALQGAANQFLSDLGSLGQEMVILHENPALTPRVVTSLIVDGRVATQRGRLR